MIVWLNSWPEVVRPEATTISHRPATGFATDTLAFAVGVVEPMPCSVVVGVESAVTSCPLGENSSYVNGLSVFASAVLNETLIDWWPAGTSTKNCEIGAELRPTVVPVVSVNGPPVGGINVRARTGTDSVAPVLLDSCTDMLSSSPGAVASGISTGSGPVDSAGILTVPPASFEVT